MNLQKNYELRLAERRQSDATPSDNKFLSRHRKARKNR